MFPTLFRWQIAGQTVSIGTYEAAQSIALLVFCLLGAGLVVRQGVTVGKAAMYMIAVSLGTLLGARLGYIVFAPQSPSVAWAELARLQFGHFYFPGAVVGALVGGWGTCRLLRLDACRLADQLALAAAPAMAIVRIGCFGAGCCFGQESTVPWAITFPPASPVHFYQMQYRFEAILGGPRPVHPTQLYLLACAIGISCVLWVLRNRMPRPGTLMLVGMCLFLASRVWVDFYRASVGPFDAKRDQVLCVIALVVLVLLLWWRQVHPSCPQAAETETTPVETNLRKQCFGHETQASLAYRAEPRRELAPDPA